MRVAEALVCGLLCAGLAGAQQVEFATWDKLFVKPQVPLRAVADEGEAVLLLYHSYPSSLHHLRLTVTGEAVELRGQPPVLDELVPTVIEPVTLRLRRRGAPAGDTASVTVTFSADELSSGQAMTLVLPLTPAGEAKANAALTVPVGELEVVISPRGRMVCILQVLAVAALLIWWLARQRAANRVG